MTIKRKVRARRIGAAVSVAVCGLFVGGGHAARADVLTFDSLSPFENDTTGTVQYGFGSNPNTFVGDAYTLALPTTSGSVGPNLSGPGPALRQRLGDELQQRQGDVLRLGVGQHRHRQRVQPRVRQPARAVQHHRDRGAQHRQVLLVRGRRFHDPWRFAGVPDLAGEHLGREYRVDGQPPDHHRRKHLPERDRRHVCHHLQPVHSGRDPAAQRLLPERGRRVER